MISERKGTEKIALDDNDNLTSQEGINKAMVVAGVIIMSSGVKPENRIWIELSSIENSSKSSNINDL